MNMPIMEPVDLQNKLVALLENRKLPAAVIDAAEQVLIRLNSTIGVAVFDPDRQFIQTLFGKSIPEGETAISLTSGDFENDNQFDGPNALLLDFHFDVSDNSGSSEAFLSSQKTTEAEFLIWNGNHIPAKDDLDAKFAPTRRIFISGQTQMTGEKNNQLFGGKYALQDTEGLSHYLMSAIQSGREEDQITACLLLKKYARAPRAVTKSESLWQILARVSPKDFEELAEQDTIAVFEFCRATFGQWHDVFCAKAQLSPQEIHLKNDVLAASDREVLLALEDTEAAAIEALDLIYQLRRDFKLRCNYISS